MSDIVSPYKEFIKKHFPYSCSFNDENIDLIYLRICENNLVTDIFEKYIINEDYNNGINCNIEFLKGYKVQFNKLLLYLPLNEPSGINFCMRAAIENILKFLYSIYFDEKPQNIMRCKFRDIKERLNNAETQLFIDKEKLNILFDYYGKFSNSIHDKIDKEGDSQLEYMESIIEYGELNLRELDARLFKVLNIYEVFICNIFKIDEKTLSTSEIIRLKNSFSSNRFQKIKDNLYIDKL